MRITVKVFLSVLVCVWLGERANAEIYQWQDERGNIHFSDEPPENVDARVLQPQMEKMGVEIVNPQQLQQWKARGGSLGQDNIKPPVQITGTRKGRFERNEFDVDMCAGVVGDCFNEQQDYVCKLRFGIECQTLYHWKVCLRQDCEDRKIADKCDSPYQILMRRPIVLTERDIGRPLPLRESVSDRDWACLSQHGFFCDEVAFEKDCQETYRRSCDELKNWVSDGLAQCKKQRGSDCSDIDTLLHYRPVSITESKKAGTRAPNGNIVSQDLFLQSIQADRDSPEQYSQLQALLNSITGLNAVEGQRNRFDCRRNSTTDLRF